jgi:hypothetical protein
MVNYYSVNNDIALRKSIMSVNWDVVKMVASEVRSWAESKQKSNPMVYGEDLCGLCARASVRLHAKLAKASIPSKICHVPGHVFIRVENSAVDVTATQFNSINFIHICIEPYPPVTIKKDCFIGNACDHPWTSSYIKEYNSPQEIADFLVSWASCGQQPTPEDWND